MNMKILKIIIAVLVFAVAVGFGAYFYKRIISDINGSDKSEGSEYTLVIESQDFQYEISKMLMNNGVVVDDSLWSLWMDKHYPDFTYINGEYYLNSNICKQKRDAHFYSQCLSYPIWHKQFPFVCF